MDKIHFKPLSEGLGLDHFAEGLPYVPPNSGRSAAHLRRRPATQFATPPPRPPVAAPTVTPKIEESKPIAEELIVEKKYAGFLRRIAAFYVDFVMTLVLYCAIVWAGFHFN